MKELKGIVTKGIGGFYYVDVQGDIYEAKGRGVLKKDGSVIKVGDQVKIELDGDTCVITKIIDRKNQFIRPSVSNIDGMIIVVATKNPKPNFDTIDKLIVMAEKSNIDVAIAVSKCDIGAKEEINAIEDMYKQSYPVYEISTVTGKGIEELKKFIQNKKVCLAGASGVGKSTLINSLKGEEIMETGDVSAKTSRGRHTTRRVEIFTLNNGGKIYDTPGFSSYDLADISSQELINYYKELTPYVSKCQFADCQHIKEKDCAVRDAVRKGKVNKQRYLSYKKNYLDLIEKERY